uniref:BED-type domain-containing protein n=1 Tax=Phytophthora ramorum TaxID=164328 RepID=H3H0X4_PHYRM
MPSNNHTLTNTPMFTKKSREDFKCSTCSKTCTSAHGYINLITHLRTNHPAYLEDASQAAKNRNALRLRVIDEKTRDIFRDIFRWCEWVVVDRLPLSFVERKMTRKNAALSPISKKTLKLYLARVFKSAEARVAEELPPSFGIVVDGCTFSGRHYIAIFPVFNDPDLCSGSPAQGGSDYYDDTDCYIRRFLLLVLCPLDVEKDLEAQSLFDLIADTLSRYNRPWGAVHFMVADNGSVNQYIGSRDGAITMIGCASHRINVAVNDYLSDYETLLSKIHALMI